MNDFGISIGDIAGSFGYWLDTFDLEFVMLIAAWFVGSVVWMMISGTDEDGA